MPLLSYYWQHRGQTTSVWLLLIGLMVLTGCGSNSNKLFFYTDPNPIVPPSTDPPKLSPKEAKEWIQPPTLDPSQSTENDEWADQGPASLESTDPLAVSNGGQPPPMTSDKKSDTKIDAKTKEAAPVATKTKTGIASTSGVGSKSKTTLTQTKVMETRTADSAQKLLETLNETVETGPKATKTTKASAATVTTSQKPYQPQTTTTRKPTPQAEGHTTRSAGLDLKPLNLSNDSTAERPRSAASSTSTLHLPPTSPASNDRPEPPNSTSGNTGALPDPPKP